MANASPASIPVVCALIERDGRILIVQRPTHKHLPLKWEFPGGKVEPGESAEVAIVREIREELGCHIAVSRALSRSTHAYAVTIEMIPFVCRLIPNSPEPRALEHVDLRWVAPTELSTFDLAPADLPVVAHYMRSSASP